MIASGVSKLASVPSGGGGGGGGGAAAGGGGGAAAGGGVSAMPCYMQQLFECKQMGVKLHVLHQHVSDGLW